jgi:bacterioferritin-associated ferredoxin
VAEYEPYTKEERERLVASMERWNALGQDRVIEVFAGAVVIEVRRYEATVRRLEATVAALTPLAETGKAVEGMPVGGVIERYHDETRPELRWSAFAGASSQPYYDEVYEIMAVSVGCAKTIEEAVALIAEEAAALAAAKGAIPDQS